MLALKRDRWASKDVPPVGAEEAIVDRVTGLFLCT